MATNNPPDVILELTNAEAQFLTDNIDLGLAQLLNLLMAAQQGAVSDSGVKRTVELMEVMRPILKKLKAEGFKPTTNE